MDQFLKNHRLPKFTLKELDNLKTLLTSKEIESSLKTFQKRNL